MKGLPPVERHGFSRYNRLFCTQKESFKVKIFTVRLVSRIQYLCYARPFMSAGKLVILSLVKIIMLRVQKPVREYGKDEKINNCNSAF